MDSSDSEEFDIDAQLHCHCPVNIFSRLFALFA